MFSTRLIMMTMSLFLLTGCVSPVFRRNVLFIPVTTKNKEFYINSSQISSRLETIFNNIAELHGLEPCPSSSLLNRKHEIGSYCTPHKGVHWTLWLIAIQKNGTYEIVIKEPDPTSFFKASESEQARLIWHDLLKKLQAEFPGCVIEVEEP